LAAVRARSEGDLVKALAITITKETDMTRILAGDIGGTKTELALYEECPGGTPIQISKKVTPSASWDNLEDAIADFLGHEQTSSSGMSKPLW
jgi:glucokinase